jgi:hypothetical protein
MRSSAAAIDVLTGSDDLRTLNPPNAGIDAPDVAQATPVGALTAAQLDSSAQDAAQQDLLARTVLSALFGLAVVVLLAGLSFRSAAARMPASTLP